MIVYPKFLTSNIFPVQWYNSTFSIFSFLSAVAKLDYGNLRTFSLSADLILTSFKIVARRISAKLSTYNSYNYFILHQIDETEVAITKNLVVAINSNSLKRGIDCCLKRILKINQSLKNGENIMLKLSCPRI